MQGFVLEGYPKTEEQYDNLKNLNIRPTLTVNIDLSEEQSLNRGS
jgi:adenylate kinase